MFIYWVIFPTHTMIIGTTLLITLNSPLVSQFIWKPPSWVCSVADQYLVVAIARLQLSICPIRRIEQKMKDAFITDNTLINATSSSLDIYQDFFISWRTGDQWLGIKLPVNDEYQSVVSSSVVMALFMCYFSV